MIRILNLLQFMETILFPFAEYWWFYTGFIIFVMMMLALDLGVFHRDAHEVSFKEATVWSMVWVALALIFNYGFYLYVQTKFPEQATELGLEFLTGYVIEKSLSVDNIFVFVLVFSYFQIPKKYQHKVLFYGILGALIFRAIFISIGSVLMQYKWIVVIFGVFLLLTGIKMLFAGDKKMNPDESWIIKLVKRFYPYTSDMTGGNFFKKINGISHATPLFMAVVFLEGIDLVFAIDSVPAIFAITSEPLIVFTSNIFAILGLRSLFFLLAGAVDKFHLLKYGLALVLIFVGLKMTWLNSLFADGHFPTSWSLMIIVAIIASSIAASFIFPKKLEA